MNERKLVMEKKMTQKDAVVAVLREKGALFCKEIAKIILERDYVHTTSKDFVRNIYHLLSTDIKRNGDQSTFVKISLGVYDLRENVVSVEKKEDKFEVEFDDVKKTKEDFVSKWLNKKISISDFPLYSEIRFLLRIWLGWKEKQGIGLYKEFDLFKNSNFNLKKPYQWIQQRLFGLNVWLANDIWKNSNRRINPYYTRMHWEFVKKYELSLPNEDDYFVLTDWGNDFSKNEKSNTGFVLDEVEGVLELLSIIKSGWEQDELYQEWKEYLLMNSISFSDDVVLEKLQQRLKNLMERFYIKKSKNHYFITSQGSEYLREAREFIEQKRVEFESFLKIEPSEIEPSSNEFKEDEPSNNEFEEDEFEEDEQKNDESEKELEAKNDEFEEDEFEEDEFEEDEFEEDEFEEDEFEENEFEEDEFDEDEFEEDEFEEDEFEEDEFEEDEFEEDEFEEDEFEEDEEAVLLGIRQKIKIQEERYQSIVDYIYDQLEMTLQETIEDTTEEYELDADFIASEEFSDLLVNISEQVSLSILMKEHLD